MFNHLDCQLLRQTLLSKITPSDEFPTAPVANIEEQAVQTDDPLPAQHPNQNLLDDYQYLIQVLEALETNPNFTIYTLDALGQFMRAFNDLENHELILHLASTGKVSYRIVTVDDFHQFLMGKPPKRSFSMKTKLALIQHLLIPNVPFFIWNQSDVRKFIYLLKWNVRTREEMELVFEHVNFETIEVLLRPWRLQFNPVISDFQEKATSQEEAVDHLTVDEARLSEQTSQGGKHQPSTSPQHPLIRPSGTFSPFPGRRENEEVLWEAKFKFEQLNEQMDSIYEWREDSIHEGVADIFYTWACADSSEASASIAIERLNIALTYEWYLKKPKQTKSQFMLTGYAFKTTTNPSIALVDIDLTLLRVKKTFSENADYFHQDLNFNLELIEALQRKALFDIYLFSDMPCTFDLILQREKLIQFLSEQGIRVLGVLTPHDLAYDLPKTELNTLCQMPYQDNAMACIENSIGQVIYERLIKAHFPATLGQAYQNAVKIVQTEINDYHKMHALNPDKINNLNIVEYINTSEKTLSEKAFAFHVWEAIQVIGQVEAEHAKRSPAHIKQHVFRQFVSYQPYSCIYIYDDNPWVLESIKHDLDKYVDKEKTSVEIVQVTFPETSKSTYNRHLGFYSSGNIASKESMSVTEVDNVNFQSQSTL